MPTYEYRCKDCNTDLEVVQSFDDDAITVCPKCNGSLKRVFSSVGISFKGSGFYVTDSRAPAPSDSGSDSGSSSGSDSGSSSGSDSGSSSGSDSGSATESAGSSEASTGSATD